MKRFVEGADRGQGALFPECLDGWIDENNPIRVIDVFVDGLNLGILGFGEVDPKATGRPSYHSSCLLKLYIYGYLNQVQSSRRLEREAGRKVEVMWLTRRLAPDHKTIADFRKNKGRAIREVCARFVALCRAMGLFTQASVAIDGSKFKAVNNRDKNFTRAKMERRMACAEDFFDPTRNPVYRLVPGIKPSQCFPLVASLHGDSDDARLAAFRMDGVAIMRSPIGAVGEHLPRIVGKSSRTRPAIIDAGRRDRDFLDQRGVGADADMRFETVNSGLALVLHPMALVVFLARRNDDRRIDKRAGLNLHRPGFELAGDLFKQRLVQCTNRQRLAKSARRRCVQDRLVASEPTEPTE